MRIQNQVNVDKSFNIIQESKPTPIRRSFEKLQTSYVSSKLLGHLAGFNKDQEKMSVESDPITDSNESYISANSCSFEDGDTPLSKTKRSSHGFHLWIQRIHYHQKQKLYHIFGFVEDQKLNNQRNAEEQDNYEEVENRNPEQLDEQDAFSCYNQFKTENFNTFFEMLANQKKETNEVNINDSIEVKDLSDRIKVPTFCPLNELTYKDLEKLKEQVYGREPEFSAESLADFLTDLKSNGTESMDLISVFSETNEQSEEDTEPSSKQEDHSINTPDVIRQLFNGSSKSSEIYEIDSNEIENLDTISNYKQESDSILSPVETVSKTSPLQRTISVIERMKSVFKPDCNIISEDKVAHTSRSTSTSSYSPVSIIVPALKNHDFIFNLATHVSEGNIIESIYNPDDAISLLEDENTPIDIKNPTFYELPPDNVTQYEISSGYSNSSSDLLTTIKFDKFAQLLFYDGSKRLTSSKQKQQVHYPKKSKITKRQDYFKNNGTLKLTSSSSHIKSPFRSKEGKFSKLSKFATIGGQAQNLKLEEELQKCFQNNKFQSFPLQSVKPILKSKYNQNAETESMRAKYCDEVELEDFMTFFETHEKTRQESEPYLERVREKQLVSYYSEDEAI